MTSCVSIAPSYAPNTQNVTLFQEKGDAKLSAGLSRGEEVSKALELQSAYAITNHIGIMANFYRYKRVNRADLFELGAGYFLPLTKNVVFESYGGISYAQFTSRISSIEPLGNNEFLTKNYYYSRDFTRYFIQPAIGFKSKLIEIAFSTRLAALNYRRLKISEDSYQNSSSLSSQMLPSSHFLIEPALTIRFGWNHIKLQAQLGRSFHLLGDSFPMEVWNANIGAYFSLSKRDK